MLDLYDRLPKPFFVMAPLDDVTDMVFRKIISLCWPPDLFFSEFVNVDGLCSAGRSALLSKLRLSESESNVVVQLWGKNPENYYKIAAQAANGSLAKEASAHNKNSYIGIDINMGCPEKNIVNNGCCSGLINNRELALEIIQAVKEGAGGKLPVSVKTRLGFSEVDFTWHELLLSQNLNALTVHARTRKEMSKVPARWDLLPKIVELRDKIAPGTKIIGNGDVLSRSQGEVLAKQSGVDGIMIGRGIFQDPYVFSSKPADQSIWDNTSKKSKIALYRQHVELFANTWKNNERKVVTLNKFCKVYINGFDGAKELREILMSCKTTDELLKHL